MYTIAYIDDFDLSCEAFETYFRFKGHNPITFQSPLEYLGNLPPKLPDCVISDIHMPGMDGFTFYEKLIERDPRYKETPFFFISGDDTESVRVRGFEAGAVDFLQRDLSPAEMHIRIVSRIELLGRYKQTLCLGGLFVDLRVMKVFVEDTEVCLTFTEFKILIQLIRSYPKAVPKEHLVECVWGEEKIKETTLYAHVGNLQNKLHQWNHEIISEKGVGFYIEKSDWGVKGAMTSASGTEGTGES